jgi:hypothetical protein
MASQIHSTALQHVLPFGFGVTFEKSIWRQNKEMICLDPFQRSAFDAEQNKTSKEKISSALLRMQVFKSNPKIAQNKNDQQTKP